MNYLKLVHRHQNDFPVVCIDDPVQKWMEQGLLQRLYKQTISAGTFWHANAALRSIVPYTRSVVLSAHQGTKGPAAERWGATCMCWSTRKSPCRRRVICRRNPRHACRSRARSPQRASYGSVVPPAAPRPLRRLHHRRRQEAGVDDRHPQDLYHQSLRREKSWATQAQRSGSRRLGQAWACSLDRSTQRTTLRHGAPPRVAGEPTCGPPWTSAPPASAPRAPPTRRDARSTPAS